MRFEGELGTWHDDQDHGFIHPRQGGLPIFVRGDQLPRGLGAWGVGDALSFEIALDDKGRKQAVKVQRPAPPPTPIAAPARYGAAMPSFRPGMASRSYGMKRQASRWPRRLGLLVLAAVAAWAYAEASRWHAARQPRPLAAAEAPATLPAAKSHSHA